MGDDPRDRDGDPQSVIAAIAMRNGISLASATISVTDIAIATTTRGNWARPEFRQA